MKNHFSQRASTRAALWIFGCACALMFSQAQAQDASPANTHVASESPAAIREVAFQTLASGSESGCIRPAKMVIGEEKEWRRVWRIHDEKSAAPNIDFSRYRVVALLSGKGGAPLETVQVASARVTRTREEITVFFHRGETAKREEVPFQFALIEKVGNQARFIDQNGKLCAVCHITP